MVGSPASPGDGHEDGGSPVDREERWLRIWAFGTSPYGLGLVSEALWRLTPREFIALKRIWAEDRAVFANAHFVRKEGDPPFTADDFLFAGVRDARRAEAMRDRMEIGRMNAQLSMMRPGEYDGLPEWAKPEKVN